VVVWASASSHDTTVPNVTTRARFDVVVVLGMLFGLLSVAQKPKSKSKEKAAPLLARCGGAVRVEGVGSRQR
jgi:hypothetical protein